jgi:ABC-2 type transport system permease protein
MSQPNNKPGKENPRISKKTLLYGGYSVLTIIVVLALVILINVGITALDNKFNLKLDLTDSRLYTITDQTVKVVEGLKDDVYIYTLYVTGNENSVVQEIANRYKAMSSHVHAENVDPNKNPTFLKDFQTSSTTLSAGSIIVSNAAKTRFTVIKPNDLYTYDDKGNVTSINVEAKLTSGIMYVTKEDIAKVYMITGHGEPTSNDETGPALMTILQNNNYDVSWLDLNTFDGTLQPKDIILMIYPTSDLSDAQRQVMKDFLTSGGRMVMALSPVYIDKQPNIQSLLQYYGVTMHSDVVIERNRDNYFMNQQLYLVPNYEKHEIVNTFSSRGFSLVMPISGYLTTQDLAVNTTIQIKPLLTTSSTAFATLNTSSTTTMQPSEGDNTSGSFVVGYSILDHKGEDNEVRLTVYSSSSLFTSIAMSANISSYANEDLLLNSISWVMGDEDSIYIRGKSNVSKLIYFSNATELYTMIIIVWPVLTLLFFMAGFVVYLRRKNL